MPWRAAPGERPDPYRVWLSEVMLQQTTIAHARPYFETFTRRWPTIEALAGAEDGEVMAAWAGLGYYARARNLLACARMVANEHGGRLPASESELRRLPGIGPYIAAAIAAIAFGRRAVAVEANVERVVARLFAVETPLPGARREIHALADRLTPQQEVGDFVQAMMDLGQTVCTPRNPECGRCPLTDHCVAFRGGEPGRFPVKAAKPGRPRRTGVAYWLEREGEVLLVRRPQRGLLGGMLALPTDEQQAEAPAAAEWRDAGAVDHVFTHFALTMRLLCAEAGKGTRAEPSNAVWWPVDRIQEAGLPTLFAKLAARGTAWSATRFSPLPSREREGPIAIAVGG